MNHVFPTAVFIRFFFFTISTLFCIYIDKIDIWIGISLAMTIEGFIRNYSEI